MNLLTKAPRFAALAWLSTAMAFGLASPGLAADFDYPISVAVADDGTVYVGDLNMPGVRKISPDGTLSTYFAASKKFRTPLNRVRCLAIDHEGKLLAGDTSTRQVYRFNAEGVPEPLLKGLGIGMPMAIAVAPTGEIYVADLELHRIWSVPAEGGEAAMFVEVPAPRGLALDKQGNLWVSSHGRDVQLVKITLADKKVEPIVKERLFDFQHNVTLDESGNAYVADGYAKTIWKIAPGGKPEKWITGEPLVNPVGLAWKGTALLIADPRAYTIFQATPEGKVSQYPYRVGGE
ncbi:MAG: NHL repeat-containing protein [Pirellulales bacterium]